MNAMHILPSENKNEITITPENNHTTQTIKTTNFGCLEKIYLEKMGPL